jgi:TRAP-type C4-dicarboxylate transport system substrate-binding protein
MKLALALALSLSAASLAHADVTLKIATIAPEGSSWMKLFHKWQTDVEARTQGRVRIKFYAGGVQGDERDVLRKIRLGQLQGGGVTAIGLAGIDTEVRALEIARTYEELDRLRTALDVELRKKFDDHGFVLLGWGDVGPVHIFSKRPVRSLDDLRQVKLWMWSDDPITRQLFTALGVHGVPLGLPDVMPALSTGTIDAAFGSPLGALALQWGTHTRYMTSMVMGQATGATVVWKKAWEAIAPADREQVLEASRTLETQVRELVRADNARAIDTLKKSGLEVVSTPVEFEREVTKRTEKVANEAGQTFSKEFADHVRSLVERYRAGKKTN